MSWMNVILKSKRYDLETSELIREIGEDVDIKDVSEDTVLELFGKLDEVSDSIIGRRRR